MKDQKTDGPSRNTLAISILIFSGSAITILAAIAIIVDVKNTVNILNIILPVFATWVGTIIAFYFGRENFEAANKQVRELVEQVKRERGKTIVKTCMRAIANMAVFTIPQGKGDKDITIKNIHDKYTSEISRLPILLSGGQPKYMIHESLISKYITTGGKETDTLENFVAKNKEMITINKGFVVVDEQSTIDSAKRIMEQNPPCQDIFITKNGSENEPLTGWISNTRLTKYLEGT